MIFCTKGFGCKCPAGYSGFNCTKGMLNKLYIIYYNIFNAINMSMYVQKKICMYRIRVGTWKDTFFINYFIIVYYRVL